MSPAVLLSLLSAALGLYVGALAIRLRRAPALSDQGWFAGVAFTAAAFAALNALTTHRATTDGQVVTAVRFQLLFATVNVLAWSRYADALLGRRSRAADLAAWGLALLGLASLVPGAALTGAVEVREVPFLGSVYRDSVTTPFGDLVLALIFAGFIGLTWRFTAAWRRGVPHAGAHALALCLFFVMAGNDAAVLANLYHAPYLLDFGFAIPIGVVAYSMGTRVVEESRALAALRVDLEQQVAQRTAELTASREALLRAEKLVALGQFSAGVSHEVSNPASVVAANLGYLEEALSEGPPPADALECLRDSRAAVERIARLTRELLDASRIASAGEGPLARVDVAGVVERARQAAAGALAPHRLLVEVPAGLAALGQADALEQVVVRLLDNAARSIPEGRHGLVTVRGEAVVGRARLVVEDDGVGMDQPTLHRAFDPFFSTRAVGEGAGLGLAVARGLVHGMRGDLRLESTPGAGTRAVLELPLGEPAPA